MGSKGLTFEEAVKFLKNKVAMTEDEFRQLEEAARGRAFTVGRITRLDIIQDLLDELTKALEQGTTLQDFQKTIKGRMVDKGWRGLTPYRVDTIFRTNIQTAYQVGRYKQMTNPAVVESRPYWLYNAVKDGATRPAHMAMDGMVRPYDDPIWNEWYPPNGFNCRCRVISLSPEALARRGLTIQTGELPRTIDKETGEILQMRPDSGFHINPGKSEASPDLSRYDSELQNAFYQNQ